MTTRSDRFGDALAIARAKYGARKPKPWGAALLTTMLVFVLIAAIAAALILIR